jgi:hypothetical protein
VIASALKGESSNDANGIIIAFIVAHLAAH